MKHLKIKYKLLLGFALVSLLTITVGLVGIIGLKSSDSKYSEILDNNFLALSSLANVREDFLQSRFLLRSIILDMKDPVKMKAGLEKLEAYKAAMEQAMAAYESTISDKNDEVNYFTAKDAYYGAYTTAMQGIINAARLSDYDAAMASLNDGAEPAAIITQNLQAAVDQVHTVIDRDSSDLLEHSTQMNIIQIAVMLFAAVCAMVLGTYTALLISKPIKSLSEFFVKFGTTGDLTLTEEDQKNIAAYGANRDETGKCTIAAARVINRLMDVNENLGKVAGGDLTANMEVLSEKDSMGLAVTKMVDSLNDMFGELLSASSQVSMGAGQISQGAQELAAGSSQQAASVEEFSNSIAGLQEKIQRNAGNSTEAAKVSGKMGVMLEESVSSMEQMLEAMKGIDESSKNITRIIKVIDDIAFQTNILALNAAVEAARAGVHGKGFAVVADEVRNLASKSAAAAKETAVLIEGSSEKVKEGNQIVDKTNSSLEAVMTGSKEVIRLINEVSADSADQAKAISDMNQGIEQISGVVQENSASAQESAAASEEMASQAIMLNKIVAKFKLKANVRSPYARTEDGRSSGMKVALKQKPDAGYRYEKYQ